MERRLQLLVLARERKLLNALAGPDVEQPPSVAECGDCDTRGPSLFLDLAIALAAMEWVNELDLPQLDL